MAMRQSFKLMRVATRLVIDADRHQPYVTNDRFEASNASDGFGVNLPGETKMLPRIRGIFLEPGSFATLAGSPLPRSRGCGDELNKNKNITRREFSFQAGEADASVSGGRRAFMRVDPSSWTASSRTKTWPFFVIQTCSSSCPYYSLL